MECEGEAESLRPADPPPEDAGGGSGSSASADIANVGASSSLANPLAARLNKLTCDTGNSFGESDMFQRSFPNTKKYQNIRFSATEEPKPGPSNSAAQFDLEVFDSGSSCSNEECWELDEKGGKVKVQLEKRKVAEGTGCTSRLADAAPLEAPPLSEKVPHSGRGSDLPWRSRNGLYSIQAISAV
jgi:hypothetical protein